VTRSWGPSAERWSDFSLAQQIIMISNDLSRAGNWMGPADGELRRDAYARALVLTDLTAAGNHRLAFRRELLRWRDLLAQLYLDPEPQPGRNAELLRALLLFTVETSRQIPHVVRFTP
jgi:hypothetical protein